MSESMVYTLSIIIVIIGIVITYIITKLKFEKQTSALEERMRSLELEKEEKENAVSEINQHLEAMRSEKEQVSVCVGPGLTT